jgi:HEAT repeat protein
MLDMGPTPASEIEAEKAAKVAALVKKLHEAPHTGMFGAGYEDDRVQAAWALGDMLAYSAIPDLALALKDPNHEVRANAATSLSAMADHASSVQAELKEALNDPWTDVRLNTAYALWRMHAAGVEMIPVLKGLCASTDLYDAVRAADLAIAIQDDTKDFIPCLMRGMADGEQSERVIAVIRQETQYRAYLPVLLEGTKSANPQLRAESVNLLRERIYASPEVTAVLRNRATLDPSEVVRINAVRALVTERKGAVVGIPVGTDDGTDNETIALLVTLLKGHDWQVRKMAAEALGNAKSSSPEVLAALLEALKDPESNDVQVAAANAFFAIGEPARAAAEPALRAILNAHNQLVQANGKFTEEDRNFAYEAWFALEEMGIPLSELGPPP